MGNKAAMFLLLAAAYSFLLVSPARQQPQQSGHTVSKRCIPQERDALLGFKHGITNDSYNMLGSWRLGRDCCSWFGITCSNQSDHVIMLDLGDSGLVGSINPSVFCLQYLEYLDLGFNNFEVPNKTVPEFLGSMKNLRHLDLSGIPFSGIVPPLLINLTKLEYLDISSTSFFGSVPSQLGNLSNLQHLGLGSIGNNNLYSTDISWLSHLQLLEYLDMSGTNISTVVDWPHVLNSVPSIKTIMLEECLLKSANQSLTHLNLTKLQWLDISFNYFQHQVASSWFWNTTSIEYLRLYKTNLYGPFPDALGRMTRLQVLDFTLNGNEATMAVDLQNLCALRSLMLGSSLSSGNITEFFEKLPRCSSSILLYLDLTDNNMTGFLPDRLGHLASLVAVDLTDNSITGAIPKGIGN